MADISAAVAAAQSLLGRIITVYLDEVSVERQPAIANAPQGASIQAQAVRSTHPDTVTVTRILGVLNAHTGQVFHRRANKITVGFLVAFYQALCQSYPDAERLYVIQGNGPVHTHPDLLVALEPQTMCWPLVVAPPTN